MTPEDAWLRCQHRWYQAPENRNIAHHQPNIEYTGYYAGTEFRRVFGMRSNTDTVHGLNYYWRYTIVLPSRDIVVMMSRNHNATAVEYEWLVEPNDHEMAELSLILPLLPKLFCL